MLTTTCFSSRQQFAQKNFYKEPNWVGCAIKQWTLLCKWLQNVTFTFYKKTRLKWRWKFSVAVCNPFHTASPLSCLLKNRHCQEPQLKAHLLPYSLLPREAYGPEFNASRVVLSIVLLVCVNNTSLASKMENKPYLITSSNYFLSMQK